MVGSCLVSFIFCHYFTRHRIKKWDRNTTYCCNSFKKCVSSAFYSPIQKKSFTTPCIQAPGQALCISSLSPFGELYTVCLVWSVTVLRLNCSICFRLNDYVISFTFRVSLCLRYPMSFVQSRMSLIPLSSSATIYPLTNANTYILFYIF